MTQEIIFITSNKNKLAQVQKYIDIPLHYQHLELPEIQSLDLHEVVTHKVSEAYKRVQKPVLVEDVSLSIHALGRLPGPFIKWFLQELTPDGICNLISHCADKSVTAEVCYGYHDGKDVHLFSGTATGTVSNKTAGDRGFGWDKLFIHEGFDITRANMKEEDYERLSPRRIAIKKFEAYLKSEYNMES